MDGPMWGSRGSRPGDQTGSVVHQPPRILCLRRHRGGQAPLLGPVADGHHGLDSRPSLRVHTTVARSAEVDACHKEILKEPDLYL